MYIYNLQSGMLAIKITESIYCKAAIRRKHINSEPNIMNMNSQATSAQRQNIVHLRSLD